MPLRDYSTKAGYDADYRLGFSAEHVPQAPIELVLDGDAVIDTLWQWTQDDK